MVVPRFFALCCLLLLLANCQSDDISGDAVPAAISLSVPTTLLEVSDTTIVSGRAYSARGVTIQGLTHWVSLEPAVATVSSEGQVVGRSPGITTIRATAGSVSSDVQITVKPRSTVPASNTACSGAGPRHFGLVGSAVWLAKDNPHFIRDTVTVGKLTIEAGALICAFPGARILVPDSATLSAVGTAALPIRFIATDPAMGWIGIQTSTVKAASSIVLDHVRVESAQSVAAGFQASLSIDNSSFYRTSIFATANFTSLTLRNSVVDSGNVVLSAGAVENTVIRRGNLEGIGAQGGPIRIDALRIEDSPGVAFVVGSFNAVRRPTMDIVTAPVIVRAANTIVSMPLEIFLATWPTPAAQAALLDNTGRTLSLWGSGNEFDAMHLRGGLIWNVNVLAFGTINVKSLTLDPGAELHMQAYFNVGALHASGTAQAPITLSGEQQCWGANGGCGVTVADSASSQISNVRVINSYLRFAH